MIASGVFNSWAAEANASRQQLQRSPVTSATLCFTGDIFADCMGTTPFLSLLERTDSSAPSGIIPNLCSTGILSSNDSLRFSSIASPREIEQNHSIGRDFILPQTHLFSMPN